MSKPRQNRFITKITGESILNNHENLQNKVFVELRVTKHTCLFISSTRVLSESTSLGSHFRENLQQTHFSVVLHLTFFLQQSLIENNKLNFMTK